MVYNVLIPYKLNKKKTLYNLITLLNNIILHEFNYKLNN